MNPTDFYKQPEIEGRSNAKVKIKMWSLISGIVMYFLAALLIDFIPEPIKTTFIYLYILTMFSLLFYSFIHGFTLSNRCEIKFVNDYQELVIGKEPPILLKQLEHIKFYYFGERPEYKPSEKKRFKRNIGIEKLHNRTFVDNLEINNWGNTFFLIESQEDKVNYFNFINQMHYFNPKTKLIVGRDEIPLPVDPNQVFLVNENRQLLK